MIQHVHAYPASSVRSPWIPSLAGKKVCNIRSRILIEFIVAAGDKFTDTAADSLKRLRLRLRSRCSVVLPSCLPCDVHDRLQDALHIFENSLLQRCLFGWLQSQSLQRDPNISLDLLWRHHPHQIHSNVRVPAGQNIAADGSNKASGRPEHACMGLQPSKESFLKLSNAPESQGSFQWKTAAVRAGSSPHKFLDCQFCQICATLCAVVSCLLCSLLHLLGSWMPGWGSLQPRAVLWHMYWKTTGQARTVTSGLSDS